MAHRRQKETRYGAGLTRALILALAVCPLLLNDVPGTASETLEPSGESIGNSAPLQYAYNKQNPRPYAGAPQKKNFKPYRPLREPPGSLPPRRHRRGSLVFNPDLIVGLAGIPILAIVALWFAQSVQLPPPPLLLLSGLLAGPVTGFLDPDVVLGNLSLPVISLLLAILLFDMGVRVQRRELRKSGPLIGSIVGADLLITLIISAGLGYFLLGLDRQLALLLGALVALALPTVFAPLLRGLRPHGEIAGLRGMEGRLLNLAGTALMVPLFQAAFFAPRGVGALYVMGATLVVGAVVGVLGAALVLGLHTRDAIPQSLRTAVMVMLVVGAFLIAARMQTDAGFVAVIVLAVVLPNQRIVRPVRIRGLPNEVTSCVEAVLLVWVAARLRVSEIELIGTGGLVLLGSLLLIARPAALLLATAGSQVSRRERLLLFWQAPRALIPATAAVVFGLRLVDGGHKGAELLVPLVLVVVFAAAICEVVTPVVAHIIPAREGRAQPGEVAASTARPAP